jgi:hypothetical protein
MSDITTASPWDDPELKQGEFYDFTNPGDIASGVVQSVGIHKWDDGKVCPQLRLLDDNGDDRTLTAGQAQLKAKLVEARPGPGDHLKVTHTGVEKRAGGKTLKLFTVEVTKGGATAPVAPVEAPAAAATPAVGAPVIPDPAAAAAAIANLTPEQLASLGLAPAQG